MGGRLRLLALIGLCLVTFTSGSVIKFNASQPSIQPPLTEDLSLRCGLADTNVAPTASAVIGKRDVTNTADDVAYVTSVAVKKDGVDIALINEHFPAKSLVNSANLQVSGSVAAAAGEKGYLQLSWHRPSLHQVGEYKCEVTALMKSGSSVVFTASVEVARDELGLDDIINHLSKLQIQVEEQQKTIVDQNTAINSLKNNTSSQINTILKTITEKTHMESGLFKFGASDTWTAGSGNDWYTSQAVTFKRSFSSPPQIITSLERIYTPEGKEIFFEITPTSVTTTGFRLESWTDHDYLNKINYMWVYWMAVPAFQ